MEEEEEEEQTSIERKSMVALVYQGYGLLRITIPQLEEKSLNEQRNKNQIIRGLQLTLHAMKSFLRSTIVLLYSISFMTSAYTYMYILTAWFVCQRYTGSLGLLVSILISQKLIKKRGVETQMQKESLVEMAHVKLPPRREIEEEKIDIRDSSRLSMMMIWSHHCPLIIITSHMQEDQECI